MDKTKENINEQMFNAVFSEFVDRYGLEYFDRAEPGDKDREFTKRYAPETLPDSNKFEDDLCDLGAAHQYAGFRAGFKAAVMLLTGI